MHDQNTPPATPHIATPGSLLKHAASASKCRRVYLQTPRPPPHTSVGKGVGSQSHIRFPILPHVENDATFSHKMHAGTPPEGCVQHVREFNLLFKKKRGGGGGDTAEVASRSVVFPSLVREERKLMDGVTKPPFRGHIPLFHDHGAGPHVGSWIPDPFIRWVETARLAVPSEKGGKKRGGRDAGCVPGVGAPLGSLERGGKGPFVSGKWVAENGEVFVVPRIVRNEVVEDPRIALTLSRHVWDGGGDVRLSSNGDLVYRVEQKFVGARHTLFLRNGKGKKVIKIEERHGWSGYNYDVHHRTPTGWSLLGTLDRTSPCAQTGPATSIFGGPSPVKSCFSNLENGHGVIGGDPAQKVYRFIDYRTSKHMGSLIRQSDHTPTPPRRLPKKSYKRSCKCAPKHPSTTTCPHPPQPPIATASVDFFDRWELVVEPCDIQTMTEDEGEGEEEKRSNHHLFPPKHSKSIRGCFLSRLGFPPEMFLAASVTAQLMTDSMDVTGTRNPHDPRRPLSSSRLHAEEGGGVDPHQPSPRSRPQDPKTEMTRRRFLMSAAVEVGRRKAVIARRVLRQRKVVEEGLRRCDEFAEPRRLEEGEAGEEEDVVHLNGMAIHRTDSRVGMQAVVVAAAEEEIERRWRGVVARWRRDG
ncbi:hypothetical protein HDU67_004067 [Dinochytrium kinnereticum]|nr:hypothetical protein HDU67_004067 [Dinochytrium kinnereticum]